MQVGTALLAQVSQLARLRLPANSWKATPIMLGLTILGSGSGGNAVVVHSEAGALLIDAGFSARELERRLAAAGLDPASLRGVLITHEHRDHVEGLRVFAGRYPELPTYANILTAERLRYLDALPERLVIFNNGQPFPLGPFVVEAFSISHDAADPVGFVIRHRERRIVGFATDLGYIGQLVPLKLRDCQALVLESNHDKKLLLDSSRPAQLKNRILGKRGHLSNEDALELIAKTVGPATRHLVLAHLSGECNRPDLVERLARERLAALGRPDLTLYLARQDEPSPPIVIED